MLEGPYKLPEGWRWVRLGEVAKVYAGSPAPQDPRHFANGKFPFVRVSDLSSAEGYYINKTRDYLNESVLNLGLKRAPTGTIVFPKSGAAILTNARAILGVDAFIVSHLAAVEAHNNKIERLWLFHWLQTVDMGKFIENPSYPSLRLERIKEIPVPLPPLEEQRRIVARIEALMARVREARRLRDQAREETERLWQSVLADTFPRPGSPLPPGWRWVRLEEVCEAINGVWGTQDAEGDPVIRSTNFTDEGYLSFDNVARVLLTEKQRAKARLLENDILLERSGGGPNKPVGRVCIFTGGPEQRPYYFGNFITVLRINEPDVDAKFVFSLPAVVSHFWRD